MTAHEQVDGLRERDACAIGVPEFERCFADAPVEPRDPAR